MNKRKIIPSIVMNITITLLVIVGLIIGFSLDNYNLKIFKFFTTDSNIIMGVASLVYSIYLLLILKRKKTIMPKGIEMFKLATTVSVVLTFLTVIFFLTPTSKNPLMLYKNSQAIFHVAVPILSLATWMLFEHSSNKYKIADSLYGIIPMIVYSVFYMAIALSHIKDSKVPTQYDWYGFCQFGLQFIPIVLIAMYGVTYLISWAIWLQNTKIDIKYQSMTKSQYKRFWSIIINVIIFIFVFVALMIRFFVEKMNYVTFKYFTIQSNVLMGVIALVYMIFQIAQFKHKQINKTANLLKLLCTVYVAITFIVTVLILTPGAAILKIDGWPVSRLYSSSNILFHVCVPTLSIVNWILFEHCENIKFKNIFYSFIYVVLYGTFYLSIAYTHIGADGKIPIDYDWYQFCSFGPGFAILIIFIILGFCFLFTWLFRMVNIKVNILKDVKTNKNNKKRSSLKD